MPTLRNILMQDELDVVAWSNMLGKVCAGYKLMENSAKNAIIYRFRSFRKVSKNLPTIFRT